MKPRGERMLMHLIAIYFISLTILSQLEFIRIHFFCSSIFKHKSISFIQCKSATEQKTDRHNEKVGSHHYPNISNWLTLFGIHENWALFTIVRTIAVQFRARGIFRPLYRWPLQKHYKMIFDKLSWILFILAQSANKIKFTEFEMHIWPWNMYVANTCA